jgi:hypothetical protein
MAPRKTRFGRNYLRAMGNGQWGMVNGEWETHIFVVFGGLGGAIGSISHYAKKPVVGASRSLGI